MSFVTVAPQQVAAAAQDLAGIRSLVEEAGANAARPTTRVLPAAADEVSAALAVMFGDFGQRFQWVSAQAQAFHAEFVKVINAGAQAYAGTEIANAEQTMATAIGGPSAAAQSVGASGLLGGILGGTPGGSLLSGLTGGAGGLLDGLGSLGGVLGSLGNLSSLGSNLGTLLTSALPGLPTTLTDLTNPIPGVANSLLPGLMNAQASSGPSFTGIAVRTKPSSTTR